MKFDFRKLHFSKRLTLLLSAAIIATLLIVPLYCLSLTSLHFGTQITRFAPYLQILTPLELNPIPTQPFVYKTSLWLSKDVSTKSVISIGLPIATWQGGPFQLKATLSPQEGGNCQFISEQSLSDNEMIQLNKQGECKSEVSRWDLLIYSQTSGKFGIWTRTGQIGQPLGFSFNKDGEIDKSKGVVGRIVYQDSSPRLRKIDIFSHVSGISTELLLLILVGIFLVQVFCVKRFFLEIQDGYEIVLAPKFLSLLFFSIGLQWCILTMPFQAPDEPIHFNSFVSNSETPTVWLQDADSFSNRAHTERLRYQDSEKYVSYHIFSEFTKHNFSDTYSGPDMKSRSPLTWLYWKTLAKIFKNVNLELMFYLLRVFNIVVISSAIYLGFRWVYHIFPDEKETMSFVMMLLVFINPSLPFFGMHVSNYFFSIALVLPLSLFLLGNWRSDSHPINFCVAGFLNSMLLINSRSSIGIWISSIIVVTVTFIYKLVSNPKSYTARRLRFEFFGYTLYLGASAVPALIFANYSASVTEILQSSPGYLKKLSGNIDEKSIILLVIILVILSIFVVSFKKIDSLVESRGKILLLIALATITNITFYYHPPAIPNFDAGERATLKQYIITVLKNVTAEYGINVGSFELQRSFWAGFGWLDKIAPPQFGFVAKNLMTVGLLGSIFAGTYKLTENIYRFLIWKASFLIGLGLMLIGLFGQNVIVHGRYLIVMYLFLFPVSLAGLHQLIEKSDFKFRQFITGGLLLVLVASSQGHLVWLLSRYH